MAIEILVPDLPESVADATVATWHKKVGETVKRDEVLVEIETDKVVLEVPALSDGVVAEILQEEGATVVSKQLLGKLSTQQAGDISSETVKDNEPTPADRQRAAIENSHNNSADQGPAIRRLLAEHDLDAEKIQGSGVGGRITREDIAREVAKRDAQKAKQDVATEQNTISTVAYSSRSEKRVPMTRLRKRIAERL